MQKKTWTITTEAIRSLGLTRAVVYCYLCEYADELPTLTTIAKECGLSYTSTRAVINSLVVAGVLEIVKGFKNLNIYKPVSKLVVNKKVVNSTDSENVNQLKTNELNNSVNKKVVNKKVVNTKEEEENEERKKEEKRKEKNQKKINKEEINKEEKEKEERGYARTQEEFEIFEPKQRPECENVKIWCDTYSELFHTDYIPDFRTFTTELNELTNKILSKKDEIGRNKTENNTFFKQFLFALYQVCDSWERARYEIKFLNTNFNRLYQRIKNGNTKPTYNNGKPAQEYSDEFKARINRFVVKYGKQ